MTGKSKQLKDLLTGDKETDVPSPITQELLNKFVIARQALTHLFLLPGPRVGYQFGGNWKCWDFFGTRKSPEALILPLGSQLFLLFAFSATFCFPLGNRCGCGSNINVPK